MKNRGKRTLYRRFASQHIIYVSRRKEKQMALKKCKECGNEVSTKAASCPKCGAVLKKKTGCLGYIGAAFLIFT